MPDQVPENNILQQLEAAYDRVERFVGHNYRKRPQAVLAELTRYIDADTLADQYGGGALIEDFEQHIAGILGKPAAVFMPSGTMAQQIALRIWSDRKGIRNVAFHPTCHLEVHEQQAYRVLHNLHGELVGSRYGLMTLEQLQAVKIPLAAVLIELPQRDLGGMLPAWDDLAAITTWAREHGIITHMDGARLWESQPFYKRSYAEICGLFDTVYVSFYKMLGGIAGALLAGPEDVIAEARVWQRRHGGNLIRMYPFVLAAKHGLEAYLPRMNAYYERAVQIAAALDAMPEIEVKPNPPHTNRMHLFYRAEADRFRAAALRVTEETGTWITWGGRPSQIPAYLADELVIGEASFALEVAEIADLFQEVIRRATA